MRIVWSPFALERVSEIAGYIARDNASAAEKWVDRVFDAVAVLEQFPNSGRLVPEFERADVREILLKNYRIIYRVERRRVSILTLNERSR